MADKLLIFGDMKGHFMRAISSLENLRISKHIEFTHSNTDVDRHYYLHSNTFEPDKIELSDASDMMNLKKRSDINYLEIWNVRNGSKRMINNWYRIFHTVTHLFCFPSETELFDGEIDFFFRLCNGEWFCTGVSLYCILSQIQITQLEKKKKSTINLKDFGYSCNIDDYFEKSAAGAKIIVIHPDHSSNVIMDKFKDIVYEISPWIRLDPKPIGTHVLSLKPIITIDDELQETTNTYVSKVNSKSSPESTFPCPKLQINNLIFVKDNISPRSDTSSKLSPNSSSNDSSQSSTSQTTPRTQFLQSSTIGNHLRSVFSSLGLKLSQKTQIVEPTIPITQMQSHMSESLISKNKCMAIKRQSKSL